VGRSSMEVLLQLSSCQPGPLPSWNVLGTARFVMVARNDELTHSVPVPPLLPTTAEEERLFKLGAGHQSVSHAPPCECQGVAMAPATGSDASSAAAAACGADDNDSMYTDGPRMTVQHCGNGKRELNVPVPSPRQLSQLNCEPSNEGSMHGCTGQISRTWAILLCNCINPRGIMQ
jgi:hypothetical protein